LVADILRWYTGRGKGVESLAIVLIYFISYFNPAGVPILLIFVVFPQLQMSQPTNTQGWKAILKLPDFTSIYNRDLTDSTLASFESYSLSLAMTSQLFKARMLESVYFNRRLIGLG